MEKKQIQKRYCCYYNFIADNSGIFLKKNPTRIILVPILFLKSYFLSVQAWWKKRFLRVLLQALFWHFHTSNWSFPGLFVLPGHWSRGMKRWIQGCLCTSCTQRTSSLIHNPESYKPNCLITFNIFTQHSLSFCLHILH